ncbi:oligouridylate-binding protein 1 isoform X4 [Physcomitrium patens]|uniref:oligouridylate-binding protein 1 isoform X4 n=1 Tax=Physcomitrium patens TaxID=3218 RepID=UPI003CCCB283
MKHCQYPRSTVSFSTVNHISRYIRMEPMASGNLPPGFDATSCRSVYVGNIHSRVTEGLLAEVFASLGPLEGCKLIRKDKSSYGFVDYFDHRSAVAALSTLNGRQMFGQSIKVNWAYASGQREDTTAGHFNVFVGDLSAEVTDATLFAAFCIYPSCSDARVMWDQRSGRSRGFGFVSFRSQQEAESSISEMTGKWLGTRPIRCNWAAKTNNTIQADESKLTTRGLTVNCKVDQRVGLQSPIGQDVRSEDRQDSSAGDGPEINSQYTTVYVGNLSQQITQAELHRQFHSLGAGVIEDVRVQKEKGFGFVRYRTHAEAAFAIQAANGRVIWGKSLKCSWGSKPTQPGASSAPLPSPPSVGHYQGIMASGVNLGYGVADILAYQNLTRAGAGRALLPVPHQSLGMGLVQSPALGGPGSRGICDSFQPEVGLMSGTLGQQHIFH